MYKLGRHPLFLALSILHIMSISQPAMAMPVLFLSGRVFNFTSIQAEINAKSTAKKGGEPGEETEFLFSTGYRVDDFNWNIAGDIYGNNPNILSELTWNDIEIYQIKFHFKTILHEVCYLRGSSGFGWIFNGENQDSDYSGDNRTSEFSRSINRADDGNILDVSLGIGYQFTFRLDSFGITPLIGYSYHRQNLTITDGNQIIPSTGPFPGLDSTYVAEWNGPFLGLDFTLKLNNKHTVFAEIEYHWADYYAKADWNLRSDFAHPKSFEHVSDGTGLVISTGYITSFDNNWTMNIKFDYQDWSADYGIDRTFFADGTIGVTRLNEVNWKSNAIMIEFAYHF